MPRLKGDDLVAFLDRPHVGVVATLRGDGRPYTVPVWWLWDGDLFWLTGTTSRVWCRQLMRDGRVSLCIEATDPVPGHVGVDGTAEVLTPPEFDIWPLSRRLAEKFLPAPAVEGFMENMKTEPRLLIRLRPEVWRAIDMRVYAGKRADREHQDRVRATGEPDQPA